MTWRRRGEEQFILGYLELEVHVGHIGGDV